MRYRRDSPGSTQRKAPLSTVGSLAPPAVNVMFNTIPEHFAIEMLYFSQQGETEAATPEQPQFTCGVQLRRRRETCGPEHRGWLAEHFQLQDVLA